MGEKGVMHAHKLVVDGRAGIAEGERRRMRFVKYIMRGCIRREREGVTNQVIKTPKLQ